MVAPLRTGPWVISDLKDVPKNGLRVFSCFHCGGGSTMGYKLAGYEVLGGVEIDKQMMEIYRRNHHPQHSYLMGVEKFNRLSNESLPSELFDLDILDGSPPCSSFSMAGSREKKWGDAHQFREGQAKQILDDLFFHFIDTAEKLKPKVVIAENVKGLIQGQARGYVKEIFLAFRKAGYDTQLFLLNAAAMGVPQRRERTFFIARKNDLQLPKLKLEFNENEISLYEAFAGCNSNGKSLTESTLKLWEKCKEGSTLSTVHPNGMRWNWIKLSRNSPSNTLASTDAYMHLHWAMPRSISDSEIVRIQSFPDDYDFSNQTAGYVCGMSVPPFMMQRIANQIEKQCLNV
jgi:DNA (cytosine-5)-methyltransferase 1